MRQNLAFMGILFSLAVTGCGNLNTPSMMNTSPLRLSEETDIRQIPLAELNDSALAAIMRDYERYGSGALNVSLLYNPSSKTYGKGQAFKDLADIKKKLSTLGARAVKAEVLESPDMEPTLLIHHDSVRAMAPEGCRPMPGLEDGLTTREIGDYKFGCSVDTMLAKQIYRPADLAGRADADPIDGRRATNNSEYYRQVTQGEAEDELRVFTRDSMSE